MSTVTSDPVPSHDLRSPEVTQWLKLGEHGNPTLIDQIASRLYRNLLCVIESERTTVNNWDELDRRLKSILRSQVWILGRMYSCEEMLNNLLLWQADEPHNTLKELIYEVDFLSLDLLTQFDNTEYSTWNLLNFLDPNHYFAVSELPASFLDPGMNAQQDSDQITFAVFRSKLTELNIKNTSIDAASVRIAVLLQSAKNYKSALVRFYEADRGSETLYAFRDCVSMLIAMLSSCLSVTIPLQLIDNQLAQRLKSTGFC